VLVAVTSGGNQALRKEEQRDWKFGATWQVPGLPNATLLAEYFRNSSDNVTASFPLLTPEIEAAFPGRVIRDAGGTLTALDARAVTFARQTASRLRWGLNLSGAIGKAPPGGNRGPLGGMAGGPRPPGPGGPGAGPPRGPGGGAMMRMMGGGQGRWSLGFYHTVQFTSRVRIAPGVPELDLLGGDALATTGTPRHALEFNGGLFHKGKGMFLNGSWSAPTRLDASDLRFGAVTKLNLNLFVELGEQGKLAERAPFTKNLRLSLRFENLLDSRQKVTDSAGLVPLSYQKDYLDPRGRVVEFEVRKMF
jgi:iron complex outermembrane recepter protein